MRLLTILLLALLSISTAFADGCYIPKLATGNIAEPDQSAVVAYQNGKEQLILQVGYKGDVSEFAWLVPTPSKPEVEEAADFIFETLRDLTLPRLSFWFDADRLLGGGGPMPHRGVVGAKKVTVKVLERKQVGVYDVSVLKAKDARELVGWLRRNGYNVNPEIESVLIDYIHRGWTFTAMRVNLNGQADDIAKSKEGVLQPIELDFDSPEPIYPLKISSLNRGGTKIALYVVADHQMTAPLLRTDCVIARDPHAYGHDLINYMGGFYRVIRYIKYESDSYYKMPVITCLSGNLESKDMNNDLILKQAGSDKVLLPKPVPAPFLANLGATFSLVICYAFSPLYSWILLVLFTIISIVKKRNIWFAMGLLCMFFGLIVSLAVAGLSGIGLQAYNVMAVFVILSVPGYILFSLHRHSKKKQKKSRLA